MALPGLRRPFKVGHGNEKEPRRKMAAAASLAAYKKTMTMTTTQKKEMETTLQFKYQRVHHRQYRFRKG